MGHKPDGWPALVEALRVASAGLREAARQTDDDNVYFPPRTKGERQPAGCGDTYVCGTSRISLNTSRTCSSRDASFGW